MQEKSFGDVKLPTNTRAMDDPFFVDKNRLRKGAEKIPGMDPRGKDEAVEIPAGVVEGVKFSQGEIRHRSAYESFKDFPDPKSKAGVKPGGGGKK